MKTEKKILNPKPESKFRIKKLNQFLYFAEHLFHKKKRLKKMNLSLMNENSNDFQLETLKNESNRFADLFDISEFKILSK